MKLIIPVSHWMRTKLDFLNANGCVECSNEVEFLSLVNTLSSHYDVMIKKRDGQMMIFLDDLGRSFKQR